MTKSHAEVQASWGNLRKKPKKPVRMKKKNNLPYNLATREGAVQPKDKSFDPKQ